MSGDTGNEYNHIMRSIAKVEAGFTPEQTRRIRNAIEQALVQAFVARETTGATADRVTEAVLEASPIAELTEALRRAALDLHEQGARFLDGGNPVGCAELAHEAARRVEAVLAKVGGNQ